MDINPLPKVSVNMFSHSVGCLFICWWFPLLCKNFLLWCSPICLFFLFPLTVKIYQNKYCYDQCPRFYCLFFPSIFMVSGLRFKSLIHFEFILVSGVGRWSSFIFQQVSVQFSQHHLLNKLSLALVCACFLCRIFIDYKGVGLFLGSLFCSIDLCVFFMPVPCCFDYYSHVV